MVVLLTSKLDLGPLPRPGNNLIEIEAAIALMNGLRVVTPEIYRIAARADYSLMGPLTLTRYGEGVAG